MLRLFNPANDSALPNPLAVQTPHCTIYDTTSAQMVNPILEQPISFNSVSDIAQIEIINNNTAFRILYAGTTYSIFYSACCAAVAGGVTEWVDIWLRLNGIPVTDSNTRVATPSNNSNFLNAAQFIMPLNAGDVLEFLFSGSSANAGIFTVPAPVYAPTGDPAPPARPLSPSIIATIAMQTLQFPAKYRNGI